MIKSANCLGQFSENFEWIIKHLRVFSQILRKDSEIDGAKIEEIFFVQKTKVGSTTGKICKSVPSSGFFWKNSQILQFFPPVYCWSHFQIPSQKKQKIIDYDLWCTKFFSLLMGQMVNFFHLMGIFNQRKFPDFVSKTN